MRNNNKSVVRKIVRNSLKANQGRNIFLVLAIMLTTFLIGSVFSIGMSLIESIKINQIRLMGTVAHAAVGHPTASQVEQLNKLDYVKIIGMGNAVGFVENTPQMGRISLTLHYFDKTEWKELRSPAYMDIKGSYPQKENEIMVSRWLLEKLGVSNPSLGMEIPLTYYADSENKDALITQNFCLSGWFTSYSYIKSLNTADTILVSQALSQKHGKTVEKDGSATMTFDNPLRTKEYCNTLVTDLGLSADQPVVPVQTYDTDDGATTAALFALSAITAFFILMGYLLIYNVLYISVSRDVRFYGLLKTLGTTPKQIKGIVTGQIMRLCVIGIPIGLVFSLLLSLVFVPVIISKWGATSTEVVVSFSPFIYLGSVVFAMLTAILGAMKPAKKAANISPIEAEKYTRTEVKKTIVHSSAQGKPYKMALRNIFRDKKRAGVVLLSLFLGVTTFQAVTTLVLSMNVDSYVESLYESDFSLKNDGIPKQKFDNSYIDKLKSLPGFEDLSMTTWEKMSLNYSSEVFGQYIADFQERENTVLNENMMEEDIRNDFRGFILGVDIDIIMKLNKNLDKPIDVAAFQCGETALIATDNPSLFSDVQELSITPRDEKQKIKLHLGGFVPFDFRGIGSGLAPTLIISNTLMNKLYANPIISHININVSDGYDKQALFALKQIIGEDADISCVSKIETMETLNNAKMAMYVLGGGIAIILAMIGIMNFINIMTVSVMVRKREFATLQSIGMTSGYLRGMLRFEGVGYAMATLLLVATLGNAIAFGLFKLFQKQAHFIVFTYPVIPLLVVVFVIFAVSIAVPELVYRTLNKTTIVERLREAD